MRSAIYARVSTDKQDHQNQMPELLACNPVLQFVDYATGKNSDRDQFQAMLQAAERHEFDELIVWSLDRLTREGPLSTLLYLDKFTKLGISVRALHDDTSNELLVLIKSWLAKEERLRISLRTKAGIARAKVKGTRSGKPVGRPFASAAFASPASRTGLEDRCRQLRATGLSFKKIGQQLGVSVGYAHKAIRADAVVLYTAIHCPYQ
jgi:DNA invertase Pin-like site-specific DNA recombinase